MKVKGEGEGKSMGIERRGRRRKYSVEEDSTRCTLNSHAWDIISH